MDTEISVFNHAGKHLSLESLPTDIHEFLDSIHTAKDHLLLRQKLLEEKLSASERYVDVEISKIHNLISYFQDILDHAGAQEWRNAAEAVQKEGAQQVQALQTTLIDIKKQVKDSCAHIDFTSNHIKRDLYKILNNMRVCEIEQLTEDSCHQIKAVSAIATQKLNDVTRLFCAKNLILIFFIFCFVIVLTRLLM